MPLTSNQRAGISINSTGGLFPDAPVIDQNAFSQGYTLPPTVVNNSVENAIRDKVKAKIFQRYQFPLTDFPKYNFTLIENNVTIGSGERGPIGALTPEKIYKFPLPDPMVDLFSVQYKPDFSYLNALSPDPRTALTILATAGNPTAIAILALAAVPLATSLFTGGLKINTFKTVTLDSPYFRQFELNWKFVPRNYTEAKLLQSAITSLKRGSAPRFAEITSGGQPVPGLFRFPKVYTMFFQPNVQFLYKFKPAVLRGISIHYDGGAGAPSFYKPEENVIENSPVESIIVNTSWLEIEYWAYDNYKDDPEIRGMPSPNPIDAINDNKYIPESDRFVQPGSGAEPTIPGIDLENPLPPVEEGGNFGLA